MNIRRLLTLLAFGMAVIPASLAAQDAEERIRTALERAEEAGIPVALLESKVEEGRAKGIPMDRIADAVQRRADGLERARQALSNVADVAAADLSVGADALESGVSEAVLAELAETAPRERRAVAIAVLARLVDAEIAPPEALQRVQEALARGPEALQNLPPQARGPGAVETPVGDVGPPETPAGDVGPPSGVPAPGERPGQGRPDGAGPPSDQPGGSGPPSDGPGGPPGR